jgi:hypothetical protein
MRAASIVLTLAGVLVCAAADIPSKDVQIAGAVLPTPPELREGAAVTGWDESGKQVTIREGRNEMVCLATDYKKPDFNAACYHRDLEPFMARGRQLVAEKVTGAKRNEVRFQEIKDGKLAMPKEPRTLYVLTGSGFDAAT